MELFSSIDIPKNCHFIYFYNDKSKRSTEWDLMRYIAIKSFSQENPDYAINFYTNQQPIGEYWDRASELCNLQMVEPETEIYGNRLYHPAHISDVFRIRALAKDGGVYCDFDTITIGSFTNLLKINKFLVGDLGKKQINMGNGVIVSPKESRYMDTWLNLYHGFRSKGRDEFWDELSVKAHAGLMKDPDLTGCSDILKSDYFYPISFYNTKPLYDELRLDKITPNTVSVHLYDALNCKKINQYSESEIKANPDRSTFTHLVNRYL